MSRSYTQHVTELREKIAADGLSRALREFLSAIPAGIGHFLDTLLRLDGLILDDRENYLSGPFGFILGVPFVIVGTLAGLLLDTLLKLPAYLGHYILDRPLNYLSPGFDTIMILDGAGNTGRVLLGLIYISYAAYIQPPPREMNGLFGFLLGVIPQTAHYIVQRLSATLTAVVHYVISSICTAIHGFYGSNEAPVAENNTAQPTKRSRFKRMKESDVIDCFAVLGLTREQYDQDDGENQVVKAFRKIALICHQDKQSKAANDEERKALNLQFEQITKARDILSDRHSQSAIDYLRLYDSHTTFFAAKKAGPVEEAVAPAEEASDADSHGPRRRFHRPQK